MCVCVLHFQVCRAAKELPIFCHMFMCGVVTSNCIYWFYSTVTFHHYIALFYVLTYCSCQHCLHTVQKCTVLMGINCLHAACLQAFVQFWSLVAPKILLGKINHLFVVTHPVNKCYCIRRGCWFIWLMVCYMYIDCLYIYKLCAVCVMCMCVIWYVNQQICSFLLFAELYIFIHMQVQNSCWTLCLHQTLRQFMFFLLPVQVL